MLDILDLGPTTTRFLSAPNWSGDVTHTHLLGIERMQFAGGISSLYCPDNDSPVIIEAEIINLNKVDEYYLLSFFHQQQGRVGKFWFPLWADELELVNDATVGQTEITIRKCGFADIVKDYTRIYIETDIGDIVVRKVSAVFDEGDNERISFSMPLIFDINKNNISLASRYLLGRFDIDNMTLSHITSSISRCTIRLIELPDEYIYEMGS